MSELQDWWFGAREENDLMGWHERLAAKRWFRPAMFILFCMIMEASDIFVDWCCFPCGVLMWMGIFIGEHPRGGYGFTGDIVEIVLPSQERYERDLRRRKK